MVLPVLAVGLVGDFRAVRGLVGLERDWLASAKQSEDGAIISTVNNRVVNKTNDNNFR